MHLINNFNNHWKKQFSQLLGPSSRLLVTVSGGLDSVVLLDLLSKSGHDLVIAHCNFGLRGEESERDEKFVRELAAKYEKEILVERFDTKNFAATNKVSTQEAARTLRYNWFASIIENWATIEGAGNSGNYILTAHHADDNIETVLMHFFRGTGLRGLSGIQPSQDERWLLRPLLPFRRKELEEYAKANGLDFVEDSSNASDKYTRNFFRHRVIPQIKEVYPQAEENILQNITRFAEAGSLYRQAIDRHLKKLLLPKGNEIHVPILLWKKTDPLHTITWEIIKNHGFNAAQTDEVIKLLDAENGAYITSPTHRIIRNRQWMIICTNATDHAAHILVEKNDNNIVFKEGRLSIRNIKWPHEKINTSATEAWIDAAKIKFPLLLRKWKEGDYFYPLGMQKKKKLSRFMIDNKLSRTDKEKIWVIESDKKIVWVVGLRIDDRVKINDLTTSVICIVLRN